jgi:hypothetical protein
MTATTDDRTTAPSRTPLLAALGIAAAAVLTAVGTFWDVNNNDQGKADASEWFITLGFIAVGSAIVYGLVVRTAAAGNPGRRSAVLGIVAVPSLAVFWAGLPMVLVSAAVTCALLDKDKLGSFGTGSKAGLGLSTVATLGAVALAITG